MSINKITFCGVGSDQQDWELFLNPAWFIVLCVAQQKTQNLSVIEALNWFYGLWKELYHFIDFIEK